eukprot:s1559_g29.t1
MLGQDQSCDARARMKWAAISAGLLQVTNVQGYVVYLATSATGANRIWSLGVARHRDDSAVLHAMYRVMPLPQKLQLRVSYTTATASASQNGTEVEDVNASNDTAVDSDEDDSDTILYNTLTDVGPLPRYSPKVPASQSHCRSQRSWEANWFGSARQLLGTICQPSLDSSPYAILIRIAADQRLWLYMLMLLMMELMMLKVVVTMTADADAREWAWVWWWLYSL